MHVLPHRSSQPSTESRLHYSWAVSVSPLLERSLPRYRSCDRAFAWSELLRWLGGAVGRARLSATPSSSSAYSTCAWGLSFWVCMGGARTAGRAELGLPCIVGIPSLVTLVCVPTCGSCSRARGVREVLGEPGARERELRRGLALLGRPQLSESAVQ